LRRTHLCTIVAIFELAGCRTPEAAPEAAKVAEAAGQERPGCVLDAAQDHRVQLKLESGRLTVIETSAIGDYQPQEYAAAPVQLLTAPAGTPKYECGSIKVWEGFAKSDSKYYKLTAPGAATVTCSAEVDPATKHTVDIRVEGDKMVVAQAAAGTLFKTMRYVISPVSLAAAPAGEVNLDCAEGQTRVTVWGEVARIDGQFYKMSASAADSGLAATLSGVDCVRFAEEEHTVGTPENPKAGGQATGNYIVLFKDGVKAEACVKALKRAAVGLKVLDATDHAALVTN
jgi:hypothetical protein